MSFKENFTREEQKEDLQYDDSAFHTFAATVLIVLLLPLLYYIYKRIFISQEYVDERTYSNCQCLTCKEKLKTHYQKLKSKNVNFKLYFMIAMAIGMIYLLVLTHNEMVLNNDKIKNFTPYDILEIPHDSTEGEIKKAYRRLAKIHHPDKSKNKAKFILITKAYEALTDPVAKANYEKYGNPDGPGSMKLAVALPSFVLNKKNHMPILTIFLLLVVVVIPVGVWMWYTDSQKYDENGIMIDNQRRYYETLNENIQLKQMPFVLGCSEEYSFLRVHDSEKVELKKLYKQFSDNMPSKHNTQEVNEHNYKAICLIYAYVNNVPLTCESLKKDVQEIVTIAPKLINNMYKMAFHVTQLHIYYHKSYKNFGIGCMKVIHEFMQCIYQRLGVNSSPFMQLPHFSELRLKNVSKNKQKVFSNFRNFVRLPKEEKTEILKVEFKDEEMDDIEKACQALPNYEVDVKTFVDGFDDLLVGDNMTIRVVLTRVNLDEKKELGVLHSNVFPDIYKENVNLVLRQENRLYAEQNLEINERQNYHDFFMGLDKPGEFKLTLDFMCTSCKGFDQTINFSYKVEKKSEKRDKFMEDIKKREVTKLEPSLFQQMLNQVIPNNNDDEEEEEDEDEENKDEKKKAKKAIKAEQGDGEAEEDVSGGEDSNEENPENDLSETIKETAAAPNTALKKRKGKKK